MTMTSHKILDMYEEQEDDKLFSSSKFVVKHTSARCKDGVPNREANKINQSRNFTFLQYVRNTTTHCMIEDFYF